MIRLKVVFLLAASILVSTFFHYYVSSSEEGRLFSWSILQVLTFLLLGFVFIDFITSNWCLYFKNEKLLLFSLLFGLLSKNFGTDDFYFKFFLFLSLCCIFLFLLYGLKKKNNK